MMKEVADLGFAYVELSHGIRITLVPGILKAVEEGWIQVSSCHNFCPLPAGILHPAPNLFQPSATDPKERDQWLRATKRSIDFAAQVKAKVLVCHLGSVGFFLFNPGRSLRRYQQAHPQARLSEDKDYLQVRDKALAKLRRSMAPEWENVYQSITSVLESAKARGLVLGFENREKFDELPLDADFGDLMARFPQGSPIGYWHDTGHAHLKEQMALLDHKSQLSRNASQLLGFHLHDVSVQGQDHQAIGSGLIDFDMVAEFWRPYHLLVLELNPRLTREQVLESKLQVEKCLVSKGF